MNADKKIILIGSGVLAVVASLALYFHDFYCQATKALICKSSFLNILPYTIIFVSVFVLSIIIYFSHEKTFLVWKKFTLWWILVSFFLIAIAPSFVRDSLISNPKEIILWFSFYGYTLFATLLILYKSYKLRGK